MKYLLCLLTISLLSCASTEQVETLEKSVKNLESNQSQTTQDVTSLDERVRDLQRAVEELGYTQANKFGTEVSSLKEDLQNLRRRVPPPAIVPVNALELDEQYIETLPEEVKKIFSDGFLNLRSGKFVDALPSFASLTQQSENQEWAPIAYFWLGVTHDGMQEYKNSLGSYNQVVTLFKTHPRASLALLRQAGALEKLGDKKATVAVLQKLIFDYPNSSESKVARNRLK